MKMGKPETLQVKLTDSYGLTSNNECTYKALPYTSAFRELTTRPELTTASLYKTTHVFHYFLRG